MCTGTVLIYVRTFGKKIVGVLTVNIKHYVQNGDTVHGKVSFLLYVENKYGYCLDNRKSYKRLSVIDGAGEGVGLRLGPNTVIRIQKRNN